MKVCILHEHDEVKFRNSCGIPVESFMEVLSIYCKSTVVGWEGKLFLQCDGVCIGSKVESVSIIFLSFADRAVKETLVGMTSLI